MEVEALPASVTLTNDVACAAYVAGVSALTMPAARTHSTVTTTTVIQRLRRIWR